MADFYAIMARRRQLVDEGIVAPTQSPLTTGTDGRTTTPLSLPAVKNNIEQDHYTKNDGKSLPLKTIFANNVTIPSMAGTSSAMTTATTIEENLGKDSNRVVNVSPTRKQITTDKSMSSLAFEAELIGVAGRNNTSKNDMSTSRDSFFDSINELDDLGSFSNHDNESVDLGSSSTINDNDQQDNFQLHHEDATKPITTTLNISPWTLEHPQRQLRTNDFSLNDECKHNATAKNNNIISVKRSPEIRTKEQVSKPDVEPAKLYPKSTTADVSEKIDVPYVKFERKAQRRASTSMIPRSSITGSSINTPVTTTKQNIESTETPKLMERNSTAVTAINTKCNKMQRRSSLQMIPTASFDDVSEKAQRIASTTIFPKSSVGCKGTSASIKKKTSLSLETQKWLENQITITTPTTTKINKMPRRSSLQMIPNTTFSDTTATSSTLEPTGHNNISKKKIVTKKMQRRSSLQMLPYSVYSSGIEKSDKFSSINCSAQYDDSLVALDTKSSMKQKRRSSATINMSY